MSFPREVQFNADEQMVSSDLNNIQLFAGQELSDVIARLLALGTGAVQTAGALAGLGGAVGGVLCGFDVSVSGFTVTVNPGLAFDVNSAPPTGQSGYRWIKSTAQQTVPLQGLQTSSAQIVLIEATDTTSSPAAQSRNVWVVSSQSVVAQALTKEVDPSVTLKAKPANAPSIPTPDAGYIPLAYVYLPASPTAPTSAGLIDVRKLLSNANRKTGILGGLQLTWAGANSLRLGAGWGFANGVPIRLYADATWTGTSLGNLIVNTNALAANTVYYCYAVPNEQAQPLAPQSDQTYQTGTVNGVVLGGNYPGVSLLLSTTAPTRNGLPPPAGITVSANLAINNGGNVAVTITDALFVGSVCTDGSNNIIPFVRAGDQVILSPVTTATSGTYGPPIDPGAGWVELSFGHAGGADQVLNATFGGVANRQLPLPATASVMIADCYIACSDTGTTQTAYFLNPAFITDTGGSKHAMGQISGNGPFAGGQQVPVSTLRTLIGLTSAGVTYVALDTTPPSTQTAVGIVFRGYVESVPRLTF